MKKKSAYAAVLALAAIIISAAVPGQANAEGVTGREYSVFIYSQYFAEPASTITFKDNGVFLISAYSGFGMYLALPGSVVAVFSAPEFEQYRDLIMVMAGAVLGDFIYGTGISFVNGAFTELFLFSGYAAAG